MRSFHVAVDAAERRGNRSPRRTAGRPGRSVESTRTLSRFSRADLDEVRHVEAERRVPAAMFRPGRLAIDINRGGEHHAFEVQEDPPSRRIGRHRKPLAVPTDEAISCSEKLWCGNSTLACGSVTGTKPDSSHSGAAAAGGVMRRVKPVGVQVDDGSLHQVLRNFRPRLKNATAGRDARAFSNSVCWKSSAVRYKATRMRPSGKQPPGNHHRHIRTLYARECRRAWRVYLAPLPPLR